MRRPWLLLAPAILACAANAQTPPPGCNASNALPSFTVDLPVRPFAVAVTEDGCWVFVSGLNGLMKKAGIVVLKRVGGRLEPVRTVSLQSDTAAGMALTHDGKLLIVAASGGATFLDVPQMLAGGSSPVLGSILDGSGAGSVYANVTPDDSLLFVSDERQKSITVIDLPAARENGFQSSAIVGRIPTGNLPIALTFSPDARWLYSTSEVALSGWNWPKTCKPEGRDSTRAKPSSPQGAVIVVDVARARTDPGQAVVARLLAGCRPVRLALSPSGERLYVTARGENSVIALDTTKFLTEPANARVGSAAVGPAPVPVAVVDHGTKVVVGNSNRFAASSAPQTLTILDAARIGQPGSSALLGTLPSGAFPREMAVSPDGNTLFLTNFGSRSLEVIDIARLAIQNP